ncbi:hypothetical protein RND71_037866 [Anisodus tanguticus]|uniref:Uncharacterized protein n=1 Tax=Anisodus tanguticus TaxID=243964 RepID=A0AAE1QYM4_9SOLA|nr:hypothetical protein RND71_037866 [Anisodus tanguticus]
MRNIEYKRDRSAKGEHHVDQLYRDECRLSVYNQLDNFCDCISMNLRDISRNSKLSDDVNEALSSMIFAASRCGELPELHSLRNLFKHHFGEAFDRLNVELLPVNAKTKQYLTYVTKLKDHTKFQIMDENFSSYKRPKDESWVESLNCEIYTSKRTRCNKAVIGDNGINFEVEEQSSRVSQLSPHVHPKLPDYDNLVAKFRDLKGEYMYKNSNHRSFSKWMR